jgi:hypothetical protein
MVSFLTKSTVETIIIHIDKEAGQRMRPEQFLWILSRIGYKPTSKSEVYAKSIFSKKIEMDTTFEFHVVKYTDADMLRFKNLHGISVLQIPDKISSLKIIENGKRYKIMYRTDTDDKWEEVVGF